VLREPAGILLLTLIIPVFGIGFIWAVAPRGRRWVRQSALISSTITLLAALWLAFHFPGGAEPYALINVPWLTPASGLEVNVHLGLDGLSVWLFALSALLVFTSVLVSWEAIRERAATFYGLLLLLAFGMLGVFAARDVILFYIFFEFTLVPLFFIIGIWGSEERRYAAAKFFVYTLAGSLLTFLGLLALYFQSDVRQLSADQLVQTGVVRRIEAAGDFGDAAESILNTREPVHTFNIPALTLALQKQPPPVNLQIWIFTALFIGFAIKVPLFPLHTWLPLAHVQAPTAGSVLLAGVLLKIGTYGFARFSMPMLPEAAVACMPYLLWLSVVGIIYGALVALAQADMKRLIAYSSVSHLGYCMLGLFALNRLGMQGGTLQMINHGLSTGGLFACVGLIYERYHTREIKDLGGMARAMPRLAFFMAVFMLASIGLPGLNGFAGEFLVLLGMFGAAWNTPLVAWSGQLLAIAVLACSGVVLGAWYMLWLYQRTFFGAVKEPNGQGGDGQPVRDLSLREMLALAPLVVPIVWIGIWPQYFLDGMSPMLNEITSAVQEKYEASAPVAEMHGGGNSPLVAAMETGKTSRSFKMDVWEGEGRAVPPTLQAARREPRPPIFGTGSNRSAQIGGAQFESEPTRSVPPVQTEGAGR